MRRLLACVPAAGLLAGCGAEQSAKDPASPRIHCDTTGLGGVLALGPTAGWTFRWAGLPLSAPGAPGPTDLVVAVWAVPPSARAAGSDSTDLELPAVLADSLLPDSLRPRGVAVAGRWSVRAPRVDCPWSTTPWYSEAVCAALGEGVLLATTSR